MERGDVARIVVGVLIILFGVLIILFGLLFTPVTGLVLFISQLLSVLIIAAGIVLINFTRLNRNLDK
jgi:hypothetical protein